MAAGGPEPGSGEGGGKAAAPVLRLAVLACMDPRLDVHAALGLRRGEAHVIRNAGGLVTDDALRSLTVSQRLLGTREIVVVQHTDCGMTRFTDDDLAAELAADTGVRPPFPFGSFRDVDANVRRSLARLRACPFLVADRVRGLVFDVDTGRTREVAEDPGADGADGAAEAP